MSERAKVSEPTERSGASGVPARDVVRGGAAGTKSPRLTK
jgi:hypothetical protein